MFARLCFIGSSFRSVDSKGISVPLLGIHPEIKCSLKIIYMHGVSHGPRDLQSLPLLSREDFGECEVKSHPPHSHRSRKERLFFACTAPIYSTPSVIGIALERREFAGRTVTL